MTRIGILSVTWMALMATTLGQTAPPKGSIVAGRVVDGVSGRPIFGAAVTLAGARGQPLTVVTNPEGGFLFTGVDADAVGLHASKAGYSGGASGQFDPAAPGHAVRMGSAAVPERVTLRLWKNAALAGLVFDETGEPMVGVTVHAFRVEMRGGARTLAAGGTALTDDRGEYRLDTLPAAAYIVCLPAAETGWTDAGLGASVAQFTLPGTPLWRLPGFPPALNAGTERIPTFAETAALQDLGPVIVAAGGGEGAASAREARDGGARVGGAVVYPTMCHAGANSLGRATVVRVGPGEASAGLDFRRATVQTANITGRVTGGGEGWNAIIQLIPADASEFAEDLPIASAISSPAGLFRFTGVPPGSYVIKAMRLPAPSAPLGFALAFQGPNGTVSFLDRGAEPGRPLAAVPSSGVWWTVTPVVVGADHVGDVAVVLRRGVRISGRVEFRGATRRPWPDDLAAIPVLVEAIGGSTPQVQLGGLDPDGSFRTSGLPPGEYYPRVGLPTESPWRLAAILRGAEPVTFLPVTLGDFDAGPFTIVLTDRPTTIRGSVRGASGRSDADTFVVAFPADPRTWSIQAVRRRGFHIAMATAEGGYSFADVVPGEYLVAAMAGAEVNGWQEAERLAALAKTAERVRLSMGETRTVALTIRRPPLPFHP